MKHRFSIVLVVLAATLTAGCKEKGSVFSETGRNGWSFDCSGDLYVHPEGDDTAMGTSPTTPLKTITRALNVSRSNQTICLGSGIYSEETFPLLINKPVKLTGGSNSIAENILTPPQTSALIYGAGGDPWDAGISATVRVLSPGVTIEGIQFSVPPAQEGGTGAVAIAIEAGNSASPTQIKNTVITQVAFNATGGGGIAILASDVHAILTSNAISNCHDGVMVAPLGITGGSLKLRKNLIMNNHDNAVYLAGSEMTIDIGSNESAGENLFFNEENHLNVYQSKAIFACPESGTLVVKAIGNSFILPDQNRSYDTVENDGGTVTNGNSRPSLGSYQKHDVQVGGTNCNGVAQVILSE